MGSKEKHDIFYHKAKEEGWRARSAFKLLQIDEQFNILGGVTKVVDLCAAPGSWSQVLSRKLYLGENCQLKSTTTRRLAHKKEVAGTADKRDENVKIVAVDLQPMTPLPGVIQIQGDITKYSTAEEILKHFEGIKADLVICDGAPDVIGLQNINMYIQAQLLLGALHITSNVLKRGGNFLAKIFHGKDNGVLRKQLLMLFQSVMIVKPSSSRKNSSEAFVVCLNYSPPEDFDPTQITPFLDVTNTDFSSLSGSNRIIIPFLVYGDVSAFESDKTNSLQLKAEEDYKSPIAAQYSFVKPEKEEVEKQTDRFHDALLNIRRLKNSTELPVDFDESLAKKLFAEYISKHKDDGLENDDLESLLILDRCKLNLEYLMEQAASVNGSFAKPSDFEDIRERAAGVDGLVTVFSARTGGFVDVRERVENIFKSDLFSDLIKPVRLSDHLASEKDIFVFAKSIIDEILETCEEISTMKPNKPILKFSLIKIYESMGFCKGTCFTADKNDDGIHRIRLTLTECQMLYNGFKALNKDTSGDKVKHVGTAVAETSQVESVDSDSAPKVNQQLEIFKNALYTIKPDLTLQVRTELEKLAPGDLIQLFDLCCCKV